MLSKSVSKLITEFCLLVGYRTFETILFLKGLVSIQLFIAPVCGLT